MATTHFATHINLHGSELIEAGFEKLAVAPAAPAMGQHYYDTVANAVLYYNGTLWVNAVSSSNAISAIDSTTVGVDVDDSDLSAVSVDVDSASAGGQGLMAAAHFTLVNDATNAATAGTMVKRDASGDFSVNTPTSPNHPATKDYVDTLVSSGMIIKGATDCSANPDYPIAVVGDTYHVSVGGRIGGATGPKVENGDVYICIVANAAAGDHATVGSNFVIVQRNDVYATDAIIGNMRFATAAEVAAGTATDVAVTPADVATMVNSAGGAYTETLSSGSTSYTITHNLGGTVHVAVYNKTSGEYVQTAVTRTDDNVIVIGVNVALAVDHAVTVIYGGAAPA